MTKIPIPISIPLGTLVSDQFMSGFRKLRTLPLREAYQLALCSGVVEPQLTAYTVARNACIKRLSGGGDRILETEPEKIREFLTEMAELGKREIHLPLPAKIQFPDAARNGQAVFTADELGALLDTILEGPEEKDKDHGPRTTDHGPP